MPGAQCSNTDPHRPHPFDEWERCDCGDRLIHYKPVTYQCRGIPADRTARPATTPKGTP
jgi:hypothetical protein